MISQKARYALRALLVIAAHGEGATLSLSQIVRENPIPRNFLQLILLELTRKGLVCSHRGRSGGYSLGRPADEISFADILRLTDGPLALSPCASATAYQTCKDCFDEKVCTIRAALLEAQRKTADILEDNTLEAAARGMRRAGAL